MWGISILADFRPMGYKLSCPHYAGTDYEDFFFFSYSHIYFETILLGHMAGANEGK